MAEAGPARDPSAAGAPGGLRYGVPTLAELLAAAGEGPAVFLPKVEAHPVGMVIGVLALGLGLAAGAQASKHLAQPSHAAFVQALGQRPAALGQAVTQQGQCRWIAVFQFFAVGIQDQHRF